VLLGAEPDRAFATDSERFPAVSELLGVAHWGCVDLARGRLARGEIKFPNDLPTLVADEPDEPAEPLHRPPKLGSCPFCGGLGLTEEDVFPRWFGRLFPADSFIDKASSKPRSQAGITVPVCGGCNNTWLSVLENDTKPVLTPLIKGEPLGDLNEDEQRVLATWAMKTVLMLDFANPVGPMIPLGFYRHFHQLRRPLPGAVVFLGAYSGNMAIKAWQEGLYVPDSSGRPPDEPNGFVSTFSLSRVVLQVMGHFTRGGATFKEGRLVSVALHVIWPPSRRGIRWPRSSLAFNDEELGNLAGSVANAGSPAPGNAK
jgi:hypothetical protein